MNFGFIVTSFEEATDLGDPFEQISVIKNLDLLCFFPERFQIIARPLFIFDKLMTEVGKNEYILFVHSSIIISNLLVNDKPTQI
jgi:hypothetical protein